MIPPRALRIVVRAAWLLFAAALAILFATYVWPTPYRYDHMTVDGDIVPVRIDRINGEAEMLLPDDGWVPVKAKEGTATPGEGGEKI